MAKRVRRGRSALSGVDMATIQAELRRRSRLVGRLQKKRATLAKRMAKLDGELAALGGSIGTAPRAGTRARNAVGLVDALTKVLAGKTMGIAEMAEAVQRGGYATSSPNFRVIVNATLVKHTDKFKRVGRGQYTTK